MAEKDKVRVLFCFDTDGYIIGWQQEFYDGEQWQAPFDTTNAVEVAPGYLDTIVMGATKFVDGQLVLDTSKQAELEAEANKVTPTAEQQLIATLSLRLAQMEAKS